MCLLSVVSLVTSAIVLREHAKTKQAYDRETAEHAAVEENFQQARDAVDAFSQLGVTGAGQSPATRRLRRQILETALKYYQDFLDQRRDDRAASRRWSLQAKGSPVSLMICPCSTGLHRWHF